MSRYSENVESSIGQDFAGWSGEDQQILDKVRNGQIPPTDADAEALLRWCEHNSINHADGSIGNVADELKGLGVTAEEPPHYWPGT